MNNATNPPVFEDEPHLRHLYRHKKRPAWGHAIIAWENPKKRAYQFEDGEVRIFRRGFYGFFEVVEEPMGDELKVFEDLQRRHSLQVGRDQKVPRAPKKIETRRFGEQIAIFTALFPQQFADDTWINDARGTDVPRRLKRHRQPAIDQAQELLNQESLAAASASPETAGALVDSLVGLLNSVDLTTAKQVDSLRVLGAEHREAYVLALHDLLYITDEPGFPQCFDRLVAALRGDSSAAPSWQVVTAPIALIAPDRHVAVHSATLLKQAASMEVALELPRDPTAAAYRRALDVCSRVRDRLAESDLEPKDLMDIREFIWHTMRPAADKVLSN